MTNKSISNRLIHESSPYLLQHARNPVDWYPWGKEALEKARAENKLLIISVGYSACHWCHVMEHESFEDAEVAEVMNRYFVSIKVDREERPDIDQVYMDAAQLITGRGGWPLNAIALPDGRPLYAGTYFPKSHWMQVLQYFVQACARDADKMLQRAEDITRGIRELDDLRAPQTQDNNSLQDTEKKCVNGLMQHADKVYGGRSGAPKFIMPDTFRFLLASGLYHAAPQVADYTHFSLDKIRQGGIYDACGGGFFRYSVDESWTIPHFEKMLYDQAQLIGLYASAYARRPLPEYKEAVYDTIAFLHRELRHPQGAYFAALDADSEGEEGKFYVWSLHELEQLLGTDMHLFSRCYHIEATGNFEGHIHLCRRGGYAELAASLNMPEDELISLNKIWMQQLLQARSARVRPALDDKILASWNALTFIGMLEAAAVFSDESLAESALKTLSFIRREMTRDDICLFRTWKNGQARIPAFLDDYAALIAAAIRAFQYTGDAEFASWAFQLTIHTLDVFYDETTGLFFFTSSDDEPLIARKKEISDSVIPSSNALMAENLLVLGHLFMREDFKVKTQRMLHRISSEMIQHPAYHARWAKVWEMATQPMAELVVSGEAAAAITRTWLGKDRPATLIVPATQHTDIPLLQGKYNSGPTVYYVCHHNQCFPPVFTEADVRRILSLPPL